MHQQTLCAAIKSRENVLIRYDDDLIERMFLPYIVYTSTKGKLSVSGYQVNNPAEPLESNEWRTLTIATLRSVRAGTTTFVVDKSFDPTNKVYRNGIVCHVKQYVT